MIYRTQNILNTLFKFSMQELNVDLYSFNVRGLGSETKRISVFNHLKKKSNKGIFLLQETHSIQSYEQKWKDEWGGPVFFSHHKSDSCGTAILVSPNLDVDISQIYSNQNQGRTVITRIKLNESEDIILVNIYAPTRNKLKDQLCFLENLKAQLNNLDYVHLILGGDWNMVFDPKLDKQGGDITHCVNQYTVDLLSFMESYDLIDLIRCMYPTKKIFTRTQRSPMILSRIDHWLVSDQISNYISSVNIYPGIRSDHSIIHFSMCNNNSPRGKGFWKFNSQLLRDNDYVKKVIESINNSEVELRDMNDKGLKWDFIKCRIRGLTLSHCFLKSKQNKEHITRLQNELANLQNQLTNKADETIFTKYEKVKSELETIEENIAKGAIMRSKVKWAEAGEKNTKYFLNLEKRNAINKTITKLESDKGIIKQPKNILNECKRFYNDLYSEEKTVNVSDEISKKFFIHEHLCLSEDEKITCEGLVNEFECLQAIKHMRDGKSPGTDGFTSEFYKFFWPYIKTYVTESLNYAYITGELSIDQKRGIITLIPKKGKKRTLLKNWRPISLLNTDYKILTNV